MSSCASSRLTLRSNILDALRSASDAARAKRLAVLPDLPAVAEALPGFEVVGWYGVIGPAGLSRTIVARLHDEFVKVLNRPDVRERIVADGSEPAGTTPEEFRLFMLADLAKWAKLVKESGAKLD